jgi:hypothetical protein
LYEGMYYRSEAIAGRLSRNRPYNPVQFDTPSEECHANCVKPDGKKRRSCDDNILVCAPQQLR